MNAVVARRVSLYYHVEAMEEAFANLGAGAGDIDLILTTDGEQVLGIGDGGMSGIERSIGKLAVYTAAGGIDPNRAIPVMLDVGTDRQDLLDDPTYIGNRHPRIRGERYDAFLDLYVKTATRLFPNALLHWENFAPGNGRRILEKYRGQTCTFNDDMRVPGQSRWQQRSLPSGLEPHSVISVSSFWALGPRVLAADQICDAMVREGSRSRRPHGSSGFVDRQGLLTKRHGRPTGRTPGDLRPAGGGCKGWRRDMPGDGLGLAEVVRQVMPTMLIGASSSPGRFTEAIIRRWRRKPLGRSSSSLHATGTGGGPGGPDCVDQRPGADRHRQSARRSPTRFDLRGRPPEQRDALPGAESRRDRVTRQQD